MKPIIPILFFLLNINHTVYTQNLIRNSSFEEVRPYIHGDNHSQQRKHFTDNARFWNTPSGGTPDIILNEYRSDSKYDRNLGPNKPRSGESMIGIRVYGCYKHASSHCREYIQTKTISTLQKNKCYEYEFYVLPNPSGIRINGLGIGFTEYEMNDMSQTSILDVEQLIIEEEILFKGVGKWVKVSGNFMPIKDFNNISIGNYYNDKENTIKRVENGSIYGYYYIDDVLLYKVDCKSGERESDLNHFTLENINFDLNSYEINPFILEKIESLYHKIKDQDFTTMTIHGHTDSSGSEAFNNDLSQKRAETILNTLESLGVPRSKMMAIGHGNNHSIHKTNDAKNRRVEIIVD